MALSQGLSRRRDSRDMSEIAATVEMDT